MPAHIRTSRGTWIEAGLDALSSGGPDAVRVEALAKALGVTRGGFYHHFESRDAFLTEILDTWERRATDEVLERVETSGGDAREKIRLAGIETFSAKLLPVDLAIRDWARRDPRVATRLRRVDDRRIGYLREQISTFCSDPADVEARCMLAFSLAIGRHFIAARHPGRRRSDVLELAVRMILA
jgi:AcrR family transcriptional regulator